MALQKKHFRLINLLTMLDTNGMLTRGTINEDDKQMLEAIERVKIQCRIEDLVEETMGD